MASGDETKAVFKERMKGASFSPKRHRAGRVMMQINKSTAREGDEEIESRKKR